MLYFIFLPENIHMFLEKNSVALIAGNFFQNIQSDISLFRIQVPPGIRSFPSGF